MSTDELLAEALRLPRPERARVVEELLTTGSLGQRAERSHSMHCFESSEHLISAPPSRSDARRSIETLDHYRASNNINANPARDADRGTSRVLSSRIPLPRL